MINTQELRIGNLIYTVDRSKEIHMPVPIPFRVLGIELFKVDVLIAKAHMAMGKLLMGCKKLIYLMI